MAHEDPMARANASSIACWRLSRRVTTLSISLATAFDTSERLDDVKMPESRSLGHWSSSNGVKSTVSVSMKSSSTRLSASNFLLASPIYD